MDEDRKHRLVEQGADALADALLDLASRSELADDLLQRMTSSEEQLVRQFKARLSALRGSRRFIPWGESAQHASKLEYLLTDLQAGIQDPKTGCQLVAAFYRTDASVFENCDDSGGNISDVYRFDAQAAFLHYARRCEDKKWLANLVLKLNQTDDYGVRDRLIDCAAEYLPEPTLRGMVETLERSAEREESGPAGRNSLRLIESLARQLRDAPLFERTRIAGWGTLSTAACVDIARVYLESGNAPVALSWLERIPATETNPSYERERLLLDVLGELGERGGQSEVAWRIFRGSRSKEALKDLLAVIGEAERETVIAGETAMILKQNRLRTEDAKFLLDLGETDAAETYLLAHAEELDGSCYWSELPLAETLEAAQRPLIASLLYRSLLDSILQRGQSKTYRHGVRYLKKLDLLATSVAEWRGQADHATYKQALLNKHGLKRSFWSRYDK